ncbi:MAG TPA: DUF4234 domain-containing protein [Candidatus Babeliales bacterium]|nr:DUF4234 domain-containing protein [Candidatus Babeliales bacterium]
MNVPSPMIKKRGLVAMTLLMFFTLGLYFFYWQYKTKQEINKLGGEIPTFWFAIIPFLNIYFDYRYAQDFIKLVRKTEDQLLLILLTGCLICVPFAAALIVQYELNNYAEKNS